MAHHMTTLAVMEVAAVEFEHFTVERDYEETRPPIKGIYFRLLDADGKVAARVTVHSAEDGVPVPLRPKAE